MDRGLPESPGQARPLQLRQDSVPVGDVHARQGLGSALRNRGETGAVLAEEGGPVERTVGDAVLHAAANRDRAVRRLAECRGDGVQPVFGRHAVVLRHCNELALRLLQSDGSKLWKRGLGPTIDQADLGVVPADGLADLVVSPVGQNHLEAVIAALAAQGIEGLQDPLPVLRADQPNHNGEGNGSLAWLCLVPDRHERSVLPNGEQRQGGPESRPARRSLPQRRRS